MKNERRIDPRASFDPEIVHAIEELVAEYGSESRDREQLQQLCHDLRTLAPDAREGFRHALKHQLVHHLGHTQQHQTRFNRSSIDRGLRILGESLSQLRFTHDVLVVSLLIVVVLAGVTLWGPVVRPTDHTSSPRESPAVSAEAQASPPAPSASPAVSAEAQASPPAASPSLIVDLAALQQEVAFPLLVPAYVPASCTLTARYSRWIAPGDTKEGVFHYTRCVSIVERPEGNYQRPPDPIIESPVTVNGKPARYRNGRWVRRRTDEWTWKEGPQQYLSFDAHGVTVELTAPPADSLPQDELIRIAESLQPIN